MKYTKAKIKECAAWVEKNGFHDVVHGASLKDFLAAMGMDQRTYYRWMKFADFADALAHAKEVFKQNTVVEYENSLKEAAKGGVHTKEKLFFKLNKKGERVYTAGFKESAYTPPNVEALKFGLKNLDPEHWKDKQDTDVNLDVNNEEPPIIVFNHTAKEAGTNGEG